MPLIEVPYIGTEFLFNLRSIDIEKYHTKPFMSISWQKSLKYFEKFNKFADDLQPKYYVLKQLKDRVCLQIAAPNDFFDGAFLKAQKCDGTFIDIGVTPEVVIVPGDVNKDGVQLRRLTWEFFIDDWITTEGNYAWNLRVEYDGGEFVELGGLPLNIKAKHPNTVLIEYTHSSNDYDFWFTNHVLSYRINATNEYFQDKVELLNFRNQKANLRLLYARNWAVWNFEVGFPGEGVNNWDQKKLYQIFKCDEVYIDGVRFLMEQDAEFELTDYGNKFPLKKMKVQLVEYDQSDSSTVGGEGVIEVMRLDVDGYPYFIDQLTLFGFGSPGEPIPNFMLSYASNNNTVEIINSTEQNNFLDQLDIDRDAFRMTGEFYVDGGILYYQRGENENYVPFQISKMTTCHEVLYETSSGNVNLLLDIFQLGKTAVTVRRESDDLPFKPNEVFTSNFTYNINIVDFDEFRARVYCNDLMTTYNMYASGIMIKSIEGSVSPILNRYLANGGDLGVQGFDFLLNCRYEIQFLFLDAMGITQIDDTEFDPAPDPGKWQKLKFITLKQNKLDATNQDKFYNDYYNIAVFYRSSPPPPYSLDTRSQITPSAPTATSAASRAIIISWGFTISF